MFGPVASDPTLWRALSEIGVPQRRKIARTRAKTREHVWSLIEKRHGWIPPSRVADRDLSKTIVIRMDASLVIAHSGKQLAAGTYKGTGGTIRWRPGVTTPVNRWRCCCAKAAPGPTPPPITSPCSTRRSPRSGPIPPRSADHPRRCRCLPRPSRPHHHTQCLALAEGALLHRLGARRPGTHGH
jgi:hypothetical protein